MITLIRKVAQRIIDPGQIDIHQKVKIIFSGLSFLQHTFRGISKQMIGPHFYRQKASIADQYIFFRSEEHTSELQSRGHLVCRLLLEKKKRKPITSTQAEYQRYLHSP